MSGEVPLIGLFLFAYAPLVKPWRFEGPNWINEEYYEIQAIAPDKTTIDGARAMLRTVLTERLGLQYHFVNRDMSIYALVRGDTGIKLVPATEAEPNPGRMQMGAFRKKAASLGEFAEFLTVLMGREVHDRTGIQGQYKFDLDWSQEIRRTMGDFGQHGNPGIVFAGVKNLGLKLEPRKEALKTMVIDSLNKKPSSN